MGRRTNSAIWNNGPRAFHLVYRIAGVDCGLGVWKRNDDYESHSQENEENKMITMRRILQPDVMQ